MFLNPSEIFSSVSGTIITSINEIAFQTVFETVLLRTVFLDIDMILRLFCPGMFDISLFCTHKDFKILQRRTSPWYTTWDTFGVSRFQSSSWKNRLMWFRFNTFGVARFQNSSKKNWPKWYHLRCLFWAIIVNRSIFGRAYYSKVIFSFYRFKVISLLFKHYLVFN